MLEWTMIGITALFGLVIGSFLNVCICRIPTGESINYPPSHCTACNHQLGVWDLIPVFSYLCLGGKCRYCRKPISKQYISIEILNAISYLWVFRHFGYTVEGFMYASFASIVIVLTIIDCQHMLLPTKVIVFGSVIAVIGRLSQSVVYQQVEYLISGILGGMLGYSILFALAWIALKVMKKEGMGDADKRYLAMVGLFSSPKIVLFTLFSSAIIASVYGVVVLLFKHKSEEFPYGPFLTIGAWLGIFYGEQMIQWYLKMFFV